ncbi:MAG: HDOD domain-containing protein, partial [Halioglobus sp.]|nr:HDOD domain-containing protein [Halioglobus sp.]
LDALARMGMDAPRLAAILADSEEEIQSMIAAMS